jgi:hypothetical protein
VGKLLLWLIIGVVAGFVTPQTRPFMLEKAEPLLVPIHEYSTSKEIERIGAELLSYQRTYYRLPTGPTDFGDWLNRRFVEQATRDSWGTPYSLSVLPDSYTVVSAGRDRELGTADDLRWTRPLNQ